MQRLPWLVFDNLASTDLDKIFLNSNVHIKDDSVLADGSGGPKYITVIDLTNLGGTIATIADLLAATTQWIGLEMSPEKGGVAWSLGEDYVIGDIVTETSLSYLCTADHTALTGDVVDGSPQQANQTNWLMISSNVQVDEFTAIAGQSSFSVPGAGFDAVLSVEINGSALAPSDFTPVSPDIGLHVAAQASDTVVVTTMGALAVVNTYTKPEADAKFMQFETAGKAYDATVPYDLGDLVSYNGVVYENIIAIPTGEGWQAAKWATLDEKGGVVFNTWTDYKVGDIVTKDNTATSKVYRCITDTTAGAMVSLEWSLLSEQGGVEYDNTTYYNKGDMVTDSVAIPSKTYYAIGAAVNMGNDPKASPSFWQELNSIFYNAQTGGDRNGDAILDLSDGGVLGDGGNQHCPWLIGTGGTLTTAWASGTIYNPGDEVSYSGWKYAALVTTTTPTVAPDVSGEWQLVSADGEPDLGNPNTLGEYPDTNVNADDTEKIGASWLISGLGFNEHGEKYKYTMTSGSLNGIAVKDGDQIIWMDGATGSEIWFFSPAPEVSGERGGLLWISGKNYIIGDVVGGSDGKQYTAIWQSAGMDPVDQVMNDWAWSCTTEGGGLMWDSAKTYSKGSIVSIIEKYPSGNILVEQYLAKVDGVKTVAPSVSDGIVSPVKDATGKWGQYQVAKFFDQDITFNVGTSGGLVADYADFDTLNDAFIHVARYQPLGNVSIILRILTGHEVSYKIELYNTNLSHVKIIADDNPVDFTYNVDPVNDVNGVITCTNSTFPTIDFSIDFKGLNVANSGPDTYIHIKENSYFKILGGRTIHSDNGVGFLILLWSSILVGEGAIFRGCNTTLLINSSSSASINWSTIDEARYTCLTIGQVSTCDFDNGTCGTINGSGRYAGVLAHKGGTLNCSGATCRNMAGADNSNDIVVDSGGMITCASSTGGTSVTINTITASGIIFK